MKMALTNNRKADHHQFIIMEEILDIFEWNRKLHSGKNEQCGNFIFGIGAWCCGSLEWFSNFYRFLDALGSKLVTLSS